ncbi:S-adenosylmethionine:tRNA ribosyltransferase-isomerase, partial [candidate division KSB1 bacterium]|nr:S-adenosylmethionine:tRNA ribosyltransferase-isomerase [candidate division KSB1 bacterium]
MALTWRVAGTSDPGLKRERNEDTLLLDQAKGIVIVADGDLAALAERVGEVPLPPYFTGQLDDPDRYQTMFADHQRGGCHRGVHGDAGIRAGHQRVSCRPAVRPGRRCQRRWRAGRLRRRI